MLPHEQRLGTWVLEVCDNRIEGPYNKRMLGVQGAHLAEVAEPNLRTQRNANSTPRPTCVPAKTVREAVLKFCMHLHAMAKLSSREFRTRRK